MVASVSSQMNDTFKHVMSRLATPVTIATTFSDEHGPKGLTCSAFMSVSAQPPIVAIGIHTRSSFLGTLSASGIFAINVLHQGESDMALRFASPDRERFTHVAWRHSAATRAPLLGEGCVAHFDCNLLETMTNGDHVVAFGLVLAAIDGMSDSYPLIYCRRSFGTWAPENTET